VNKLDFKNQVLGSFDFAVLLKLFS